MKKVDNKNILKLLFKLIDSYKTKNYFDTLLMDYPQYIDEKKKGMPIGSLVSQIFANIYLNSLDHYMKDYLMQKYYIGYVDDILIFFNNKQDLDAVKEKLELFVENKLKLVLNPKKIQIIKLNNNNFTFWGIKYQKRFLCQAEEIS